MSAELLAFLADQRGHRSVAVSDVEHLYNALPFEPSVAILRIADVDETSLASIGRLTGEFPALTVVVTSEARDLNASCLVLEHGAHDFVRSPYNPREVILRAERWFAARSTTTLEREATTVADLRVDLARYVAVKNEVSLQMTKLELRLLYCLCEHHPHLAPTERLLNFGWDHPDEADAALIKTHISHIRRKLQDAGGTDLRIRSRQTVGYELVVAPA